MSMTKCPECNGDVSTRAETCPHCGYPLKPKQEVVPEEYVLSKGSAKVSGFASFLRVMAWITWGGGLIISIAGAQVTELGRYSTSTHFSFTNFLTLFISYFIYGILMMCMATVVDQVSSTYSIVSGLGLGKRKESKTSSGSGSKPNYLSGKSAGAWTCPTCKYSNKSWDEYCARCGGSKKG